MKFLLIFLFIFSCSKQEPVRKVFFIEPKDSSELSSPFKVQFGVENLVVEPAGEVKPNSGHHHILINLESTPEGEGIPFDETHKHFGKGQTEAELSLEPGQYKLTLQFANGAHQSYGKALSDTISITVK